MKANRGVELEAVKQNGRALQNASEDLKVDHGVVLEAVKQDGRADLTRNTRAPHFTPQHWLLCHMGLY